MHNAFVEILREDLGGAYVDMQEIAGGMDLLPNAFYGALEDRGPASAPRCTPSTRTRTRVTVHFKTEAGRVRRARRLRDRARVPFSVLRSIEALTPFSREKQRAIRQLNYHASTKVLFQVRHRRLGDRGRHPRRRHRDRPADPADELPDARPHHRARHAARLLHLGPGRAAVGRDGRRRRASRRRSTTSRASIRGSARSTRSARRTPGTATAGRAARSRCSRRSSRRQLQADIVKPEGRIHFAGEHCSLYHAWIQGALESGIRAAREIHEAADARDLVADR